MGKLDSRIAIIAGGAMGMGYGAASVMARNGATIVLVDNSEKVYESTDRLIKGGYQAVGYKVDVRDAKGLIETYKKVVDQFSKIDILVNSAGISKFKPFLDVSDEELDLHIGINFKGIWNSCKAAAPYMIKNNYGKIVNFSSVTGPMTADPCETAYASTKGAILAFTKALAQDLVQFNITVNAILPGIVQTPMMELGCWEANPDDPQSVADAMAKEIPMKRVGTIEEAGELVAFLASDESRYITGTQVVLDGGFALKETSGSIFADMH